MGFRDPKQVGLLGSRYHNKKGTLIDPLEGTLKGTL